MLYLADTSAWNRSHRVAPRWAALVEAQFVALCPPVELELLYFAQGRADYRERKRELRGLVSLPLDRAAVARALDIQADLAERSQHRGPTTVDLFVAAIAETSGAVLLHYDRHLDAIVKVTGQPAEWLGRRGSLD